MMVRILLLINICSALMAAPSGYQFTEGRTHTVLSFELYQNLIVIPAQLNDTLNVRLILDTGSRSVILYGKRFAKLSNFIPNKKIRVCGWGNGQALESNVSYPNQLVLGDIEGSGISMAVIPQRKLVSDWPRIDGVIGYELFVRFAVEINYRTRTIHLYDRLPSRVVYGFASIPLEVSLAKPHVAGSVMLANKNEVTLSLLVDTGSSLGLAVFTKEKEGFSHSVDDNLIGVGLAGMIRGFELFIREVFLDAIPIGEVKAHLIHVRNHPDPEFQLAGSLGGGFLKDHIVVFDYPGKKLWLKRVG